MLTARPSLPLAEFAPRSALVRPAGDGPRTPRFPVIDAHNHLGAEFGGGWDRRPVAELVEVLDEAGVRCLVDLDGGWGESVLDARLARKAVAPDRFRCFGGVDWSQWPRLGHRFPDWAAGRLTAQVGRGADGLKIWKPLGLRVLDDRGRRVPVDDPRLDVLWSTAGDLKVPVTIHVADPVAFFRPLDRHNERYEMLRAHPDWHVGPGPPRFSTIIEEFARLVARHPGTTFIGAHVGCYAENLPWVSALLDRCPNLFVDLGARFDELSRQPHTARRFFLRHRDRILYGADYPVGTAMYRATYRFLETDDEHFCGPGGDRPGVSWPLTGLDLPDDVLERVYGRNAARVLLGGDSVGGLLVCRSPPLSRVRRLLPRSRRVGSAPSGISRAVRVLIRADGLRHLHRIRQSEPGHTRPTPPTNRTHFHPRRQG